MEMVAAHPSNPTATTASEHVLLESGVVEDLEEYRDLDGSAVTTSELRAWYGFAACLEPISYCGVAVFLPLLIQTLAAGNGFTTANHSVRCDTSVDNYSCVVRVGSGWVDSTSFFFYLVVIAAIAQTLLFIAIGALADHGVWRKKLMLAFGGVAAIIGILFPVITRDDEFWLASVFFVILNIAIGMSWVFVYAYLPFLSRNHVDYLALKQDKAATQESLALKLDQITNRISSHAFMWMYGGTLLMLILLVTILLAYTPVNLPSSYSINVGIFFCGLCMISGILVAHRWLRERPGPPFPSDMNPITYSTKKVATSLCKVRELKNLFLFLIGWFM
ncbi:autophagy-related protein 22-like protein, partial [Chytriomyces sp. MP71]